MSPGWLEPAAGGVRLRVHAQPGAKRTETAGLHGDALKVRLHAPPVDGRANDELVRFLAGALGCRRSEVTIVAGAASRDKTVFVAGVAAAAARRALEETPP